MAGLVLLAPLAAMQFTPEVQWMAGDFLIASLMIGAVGLAFELCIRASPSGAYRAGVASALAAAFLVIWTNGAVGMIGSEDNPYNLLFLGVILVALLGSVLSRFRAKGMVLAMAAATAAQAALGFGGMASDLRGGILSVLLAGLWLLAAALFRNAVDEEKRQRDPDEAPSSP